MKCKRITEEQIIGILKEADAGAKSTDLCRRHAISEQTFYRWKARPSRSSSEKGLTPVAQRTAARAIQAKSS